MIDNLVTNWVMNVINKECKMVIVELTPTNLLNAEHIQDVETGVEYRVFNNTNLVSLEGLKFDGYSITPNSLEYADSLFSSIRFSDNHIIISDNYLSLPKITKECVSKANNIGAKYFAVYSVANDNSEEVIYGSITPSNSDKCNTSGLER